MTDPSTISLDIETYGACTVNADGSPLPSQTVFHPRRSLLTDGVSTRDLVLTVSLTMVSPYKAAGDWNLQALADAQAGDTMVFELHRSEHRHRLRQWLFHADTIIGMNLQFDIQYLRALNDFKFALNGRHQLIDLSVLNYLHDETRPERSLKSLGPILRTHSYEAEQTLKHTRFGSPSDPKLLHYNAQDTHNTLLACQELARRIQRDFSASRKASPECLRFYSDTIWSCIRMSESGIPMDRNAIQDLESDLMANASEAVSQARDRGLILEGEGSGKSKEEFMSAVVEELGIQDDPRLQLTPKQGLISFCEENRKLLCSMLPPDSPHQKTLAHAATHSKAQKLVGSYCFPLLRHRRNFPTQMGSVLLKSQCSTPTCVQSTSDLTYPTWFVTPSPAKDGQGDAGGTKQGRITCKGPSAQTFPRPIKACIQSRWWEHGAIVSFDLSQIELRVAALLSGATSLSAAYNDGLDLHTDRAVSIFGTAALEAKYGMLFNTNPDFKGHERQCGKRTNFADLFRSSAPTMKSAMMEDTGIDFPLSLFQKIVNDRPIVRPGLWGWQEEMLKLAEQRGYVELPITGQSRYFVGFSKTDRQNEAKNQLNEIINFPIQTTAGNTLLNIQHELHRRLPDLNSRDPWAHMFLNIYDAVYFDCKLDRVSELEQLIGDAVREVVERGYWARLQELYGREIPVEFDVDVCQGSERSQSTARDEEPSGERSVDLRSGHPSGPFQETSLFVRQLKESALQQASETGGQEGSPDTSDDCVGSQL